MSVCFVFTTFALGVLGRDERFIGEWRHLHRVSGCLLSYLLRLEWSAAERDVCFLVWLSSLLRMRALEEIPSPRK